MKITDIIKPITLLHGTHDDTDKTGQGCFMNVIAYLNGDQQITDQSDCVCITIRPLAIWFNDWLRSDERHELIPYIERAMGSANQDKTEITRRLQLVVAFTEQLRVLSETEITHRLQALSKYAVKAASKYAVKAAQYTAQYAAECYTKTNEYAIEAAAKAAAKAAQHAAEAGVFAECAAEYRAKTKAATFKLLDEALPKAQEFEAVVYQRSRQLVELAEGK